MILSILRYFSLFFIIVIVHLFILNNIFIGNYYGFLFQPQLIVMFVLLLPYSMKRSWMILISFIGGFMFDVFFQSWGIHAAVCTLIGFTRHYATKDLENVIGARNEDNQIWTSKKGQVWKWTYFLTFTAIYHFLFLLIESHGHNFFTRLLPSFVCSTLIALVLILLLENLIYKPARN
jgi:hypothetical protein